MRHISGKLTQRQLRARTKRVTTRNWKKLPRIGEQFQFDEQCQGLKKGEKVKKICVVVVVSAEWCSMIARFLTSPDAQRECELEGFPEMTGRQFWEFYVAAHKGKAPDRQARIEFAYVEDAQQEAA